MHGLRPMPTDQITPPTPPAHNIVTGFGAEIWAELNFPVEMFIHVVVSCLLWT